MSGLTEYESESESESVVAESHGARTLRRWWFGSVLIGVLAGVLWWAVTDTAEWVVTADGASLSEGPAQAEFGAVATFVVIGAMVGVLLGLAVTVTIGAYWWLVPAVAIMSGYAAGLAWLVGRLLGPDGPRQGGHQPVGTKVPDVLTVNAAAPFVAWAVFGVAGVLLGTWVLHRRDA